MAGEGADNTKEGIDFEWVGDGLKTRKFFTREETSKRKKAAREVELAERAAKKAARKGEKTSAPATSTRPKARPAPTVSAKESAPKSPTRPTARPEKVAPAGPTTRSGPRRKPEAEPSNPRRGGSRAQPSSNKPFAGTKPTKAELEDMSIPQKIRWGVLFSRGTEEATPSERAPRKNIRGGGSRGNQAKVGMAKGGMVKANCGASMKPTQKSTRKK